MRIRSRNIEKKWAILTVVAHLSASGEMLNKEDILVGASVDILLLSPPYPDHSDVLEGVNVP